MCSRRTPSGVLQWQVARHPVELGLDVAGEHYARALLREAASRGLADAGAGAGDDDDPVCETNQY